jgi:hypothetical protein
MNTYKKMGPPWGAQKSTIFRQKATNRMRFWRVTKSSFCALTKVGGTPFLSSSLELPSAGLNLRPQAMVGNYAWRQRADSGLYLGARIPLNDILPA